MKYHAMYCYMERNPSAIAGRQPSFTTMRQFKNKEQVNKFIEDFTKENKILWIRVIEGKELPVTIKREEYQEIKIREKIVGL